MTRYIVLAESKACAEALKTIWLPQLCASRLEQNLNQNQTFTFARESVGVDIGIRQYSLLASQIDSFGADAWKQHEEVVAVVDCVRPEALSAITEGSEWEHLVALLILTFPEVTWSFAMARSVDGFDPTVFSVETIVKQAPREPLFDPKGLRNWVRRVTNDALNEAQFGISIPIRSQRAAAIDEERSYAFFNGYVAYRFGYLADPIFSWRLMVESFRKNVGHGYALLFEDMSLHFPDRPAHEHIARLSERARSLPSLASSTDDSRQRILITAGEKAGLADILSSNRTFLNSYKRYASRILLKPVGGMLDLWLQAGLLKCMVYGHRLGNAPLFCWPLQASELAGSFDHGAPGKLVLVAETLIARAERLRRDSQSFPDYIRGAVLATDAAELLCGRTPILALSAIALKHEFETRAECAFMGAAQNIEIRRRIEEIRLEVDATSGSFAESARKMAGRGTLATILNRIALIFRETGQFSAEEACMVELRRAQRSIAIMKTRWQPINLFFALIMAYIEWAVASMSRLTLAISFWFLSLYLAWILAAADGNLKSAFDGIGSSFFGGNFASDTAGWSVALVSGIAVILGFLHLGIFISYLYSHVVRK